MKRRLYETLKRNDIKSVRKRGNLLEIVLKQAKHDDTLDWEEFSYKNKRYKEETIGLLFQKEIIRCIPKIKKFLDQQLMGGIDVKKDLNFMEVKSQDKNFNYQYQIQINVFETTNYGKYLIREISKDCYFNIFIDTKNFNPEIETNEIGIMMELYYSADEEYYGEGSGVFPNKEYTVKSDYIVVHSILGDNYFKQISKNIRQFLDGHLINFFRKIINKKGAQLYYIHNKKQQEN